MPPRVKPKTFNPYTTDSRMDGGPHALTHAEIRRHVPPRRGVYLLLSVGDDGEWKVTYVGRHFRNIAGRLAEHVGEHDYTGFYFRETSDRTDTFLTECEEFHRYGGIAHLDNEVHPSRPKEYNGPLCSRDGCNC